MMFKHFVGLLLLSLCAGQWPSAAVAHEEALPVVEVSLASPADPLPEVSAQIGGLDRAREAAEAEGMAKVHRGFNEALRKASLRFEGLAERVGRIFEASLAATGRRPDAKTISFANAGGGPLAAVPQPAVVTVEVGQASQPDVSVVGPLLEDLESSQAHEERSLFESAVEEFDGLTDTVLAEVLAQVQSLASGVASPASGDGASFDQTGFLAGELPPEHPNVRAVEPDVPYPTVASLAQDMEARRSISSGLVRARLLELDLSLLKRENEMVRKALKDASKRFLTQVASTARAP